MKICSNCVLPETFPGISFDAQGVCNHCRTFRGRKTNPADLKERYKQKFLRLLSELKDPNQPNQSSGRPYDAIMAYSGGKDSSYTLKVLRQDYGLKVLAVTFNHGFLSPRALKNIERIKGTLGIDHVMVSPNPAALCHAFRESIGADVYPMKALGRASSVCNTCMNLVKSHVLKSTVEMGIPLTAYGWSPGQAPLQSSVLPSNAAMIRRTQQAIFTYLHGMMGEDLDSFILQERHLRMLEAHRLYNVHPLAFLEYDEGKILREIEALGWEFPDDTDANSTNCLLNGFANETHMAQHGFHPYAFEIGGLVREGYMTREEGLKKLSTPADPRVIDYVKGKLGIPKEMKNIRQG